MRKVLITGASSDIGLAVTRVYLNSGFAVIGHFRRKNAALGALISESTDSIVAQGDFATPKGLETFIFENQAQIKQCDVLINLAGNFFPGRFEDLNVDDFLSAIVTNSWPTFRLIQELAPQMQSRQWGRIVNIGSIGVKFRGGSISFNYAMSKHLIEFIPNDYKKWASDNVFINTLRVGVTDTKFHDRDPSKQLSDRIKMIPAARAASTEDIARAVYFYGSNQNGFATGETITIAGGE